MVLYASRPIPLFLAPSAIQRRSSHALTRLLKARVGPDSRGLSIVLALSNGMRVFRHLDGKPSTVALGNSSRCTQTDHASRLSPKRPQPDTVQNVPSSTKHASVDKLEQVRVHTAQRKPACHQELCSATCGKHLSSLLLPGNAIASTKEPLRAPPARMSLTRSGALSSMNRHVSLLALCLQRLATHYDE